MSDLEVRDSVHGRGVFALRDFREGDLIQRCPVMVIPPAEIRYNLAIRALEFYCYTWSESHWSTDGLSICLGYGSLFNNSEEPNLTWTPDPDRVRTILFHAKRDIAAGEELTHYYAWPEEQAKVGFGPTDVDGLPIQEPLITEAVRNFGVTG